MCIIYLFSVHKRIEDFDKISIFSAINQKKKKMRAFQIWRQISKSDFTFCKSKVITRFLSSHAVPEAWTRPFDPPSPEFDWLYLCDDKNRAAIEENIVNRKGVGDINQVVCRTCFDLILYQRTLQKLFT